MWGRTGAGTRRSGCLVCIQYVGTGHLFGLYDTMLLLDSMAYIRLVLWQCGHGTFSGRTHVRGAHVFGDCFKVKFVLVAFSMDFVDDLLVIVVTDSPAEFVIVHAGFAFADTP